MTAGTDGVARCPWARDPLMIDYHDSEWGVPLHGDRALFEFLILEGAAGGPKLGDHSQEAPRLSRGLRRLRRPQDCPLQREEDRGAAGQSGHRAQPAQGGCGRTERAAFLAVQKEFGSFDAYIWGFTGGHPLQERMAAHGRRAGPHARNPTP